MKTFLVVLGAGGHTNQLLKLVETLGPRYNYEYVIGSDDKLSENKIKYKGRIFKILNPRKMEDKGMIKTFFKFIPSSVQVLSLLVKSKADVVLMCGPAISLHIALLAKLFRKKVIFLESWSRVYTKSWAGNAIYKLGLYDLFFIQWPQEKKNYKKAIYTGRLG